MKKLFSIKLLILIIAGLLVSYVVPTVTPAQTPAGKTFNLKFASWLPQQEAMNYATNLWMKGVEERTNGRVKVTPYYGETLGKSMNSLDMLRTGVCDIALFPTIYFSKQFRVLDILALPGLVPNRTVGTEIIYTLLRQDLLKKELANYRPVVMQGFDPGFLVFSKKKVTKAEELKGMKIRFTSATTKMALEALGATPVSIPGPELFSAVNTGIVDGTTISPAFLITAKLQEITKYVVWGNSLFCGANIVLMSQKTWNSLPVDVQLIMEELSAKAKYDYLDIGHQADIDALNAMKAAGMDLTRLSPEESKKWQKLFKGIEDQWVSETQAAGFPGKEALEITKKVIERSQW